MKGKIVSVSTNAVTMSHDDGNPNATHDVAKDASITLNGKPSKLADLKAGDGVELTGYPATTVVCQRP